MLYINEKIVERYLQTYNENMRRIRLREDVILNSLRRSTTAYETFEMYGTHISGGEPVPEAQRYVELLESDDILQELQRRTLPITLALQNDMSFGTGAEGFSEPIWAFVNGAILSKDIIDKVVRVVMRWFVCR